MYRAARICAGVTYQTLRLHVLYCQVSAARAIPLGDDITSNEAEYYGLINGLQVTTSSCLPLMTCIHPS